MMYFVIAFIVFLVFSYYATLIDDLLGVDCLPVSFLIGVIASLAWPVTLVLTAIAIPAYFVMRWGAKRRDEI